MTTRQRNAPAR